MVDFLHKLINISLALHQMALNLAVYGCVLLIWPPGLSPEMHMLINTNMLFGLLATGWCVSTHFPGERHSLPLMPVINQAQREEEGGGGIRRKKRKRGRQIEKEIWNVNANVTHIPGKRGLSLVLYDVADSQCSQAEPRAVRDIDGC